MMEKKRDILWPIYFLFTKIKEKYSLAKFMATQKNILKLSKDAVPLANKLSRYFNFLLEKTGGMYFYLDHKVSSTLIMSENNGQIILSKGRKGSFFNILRVKLYIYLAFLLKGILLIPLIGKI